MQSVILYLPENVMQRAKTASEVLKQPVEDILITMLNATLPDLEDAPVTMQAELTRMTWLSSETLWAIAESSLAEEDEIKLNELSKHQDTLSPTEKEMLENLRQAYGQTTLRKARAYALLSIRGGQSLLQSV